YGHKIKLHVKRMINGKTNGAKLIMMDTRLSNTATHADHYIAPYPGSEAAILLAIANYLIQNDLYNREFVRRWWNWEEYLEQSSQPRSGEMFMDADESSPDSRSNRNATHFDSSGLGLDEGDGATNISRLRREDATDAGGARALPAKRFENFERP